MCTCMQVYMGMYLLCCILHSMSRPWKSDQFICRPILGQWHSLKKISYPIILKMCVEALRKYMEQLSSTPPQKRCGSTQQVEKKQLPNHFMCATAHSLVIWKVYKIVTIQDLCITLTVWRTQCVFFKHMGSLHHQNHDTEMHANKKSICIRLMKRAQIRITCTEREA